MFEFFRHLFSADFMPHGHCYLWRPEILWLHVLADGLIATAYMSIPASLVFFVRKRGDIAFEWMFVMFGAFIFACGATHFMEIWTVWIPSYRLAGVIKAFAGIVSAGTAISLWRIMPRMLALPSPTQLKEANRRLQAEIVIREKAEQALQLHRDELERRVQERTADLQRANEQLREEAAQRRRAEENVRAGDRQLQAIVDHSPALMLIVDSEGRYLLVNRYFEKIFHVTSEQALGKRPEELFPPDLARALRSGTRETFDQRRTIETEDELPLPAGRAVFLSVKFPLLDQDGNPYAVCINARDITARKREQAELEEARAAAERASAGKSKFLSRISHELRTPLNSILGFAQLLTMDHLGDEQRESVDQILRGGRQLVELVNEVLDISRAESGVLSLSPEPVAVTALLEECIKLVEPLANQRGIRVAGVPSGPEDEHVLADVHRLRQVVMNLLSNAIKFNHEGGSVSVSHEIVSASQVRMTVRDTGIGIAKEDQDRVFYPFERLENAHPGVEGVGLGLALAKQLVELMNGRMGVESELRIGSSFWIELPLTNRPLAQAASLTDLSIVQPENGASRVLLYIEDNLSNVRLLERVIVLRPGVKLLVAIQGSMGLDLARQHRPDLILLDLHLPDMHGSDVLRQLQRDVSTQSIPVVVISADATKGEIERLRAGGARHYLTKPLDIPELFETIDRVLKLRDGESIPLPT